MPRDLESQTISFHNFDTSIGGFYVKDYSPGDTLTFMDALHVMMLESSNVTAQALARSAAERVKLIQMLNKRSEPGNRFRPFF